MAPKKAKAKVKAPNAPGPSDLQVIQKSGKTARGMNVTEKGKCAYGRCLKTSDHVDFPYLHNERGQLVMHKTACAEHWDTFCKGWSNEYDWPNLCSACDQAQEIADAFDESNEVNKETRKLGTGSESASTHTHDGWGVYKNYAIIPEGDFADAVNNKNMSAALADMKVDDLTFVAGMPLKGVVIRDPTLPFLQVKTFRENYARFGVSHIDSDNFIRRGSGQKAQQWAHDGIKDSLPASLRGNNAHVPSLKEIQIKAAGIARGLGLDHSAPSNAEKTEAHPVTPEKAIRDVAIGDASNVGESDELPIPMEVTQEDADAMGQRIRVAN